MTQKIFCVGLNGQPGNLEAILEGFAPHIHEVFAAVPPSLMGSGRAGAMPLTLEKIAEQVKTAHAAGVGYNALLNAVSLGGKQFQSEFLAQFRDFLDFAAAKEIDGLTIAEPFLIHQAVRFRDSTGAKLNICVSSLADITDAVSAKRHEEMGVDRIVLHQNVNRDIPSLRKILESVSCEIELYANSGSLYKCPYRQAHRMYVSHLSTLPPEALATPDNQNWYKANCIAIRKANPIEIVMAPTIRPEDVSFYQQCGIPLFKISGRAMPTDWLLKILGAYTARCWGGNVADLCDTNMGKAMPFVANRSLDGLLHALVRYSGSDYERVCREFLPRDSASIATALSHDNQHVLQSHR